jgi:iron complex outermembrane receptor protein
MRRAVLAIAAAAGCGLAAAQSPPAIPRISIEVVGTSPLPGLATPIEQVPSNVQTFGASELSRQRTGGVAEFLNLNANSVSLDSPTGNSFQSDVSFRGFTASPLLGTPQGLSVFQDGVRINEAFADVVYWDLLPKNAVASIQLLPGSNPVFGLNTLGGALTLNMKDGFQYAGASAETSAGSFGRTEISAEGGVHNGALGAFAAFEGIDETGWRDHASTRIRRLYARADYRAEGDEMSVAATLADNHLEGTQALPVSMLPNPQQAYTWPDTTDTTLGFVNGNWRHSFDSTTIVAANAYFRQVKTSGSNSNVNGDYAPPGVPNPAFNVLSDASTRSWGASMQATLQRLWGSARHQLVAGAAIDTGTTDFTQANQPAIFANDRETIGAGDFVPDTSVTSANRYTGFYVADTIAIDREWTLALSGRYNVARITTQDHSGMAPAIDGTTTYRRFNPAAGVTWTASPGMNVFGGVSQGMRVPSPIELTCADPNAPCTLPNIFVADPPLQPVRATTYEFGVRGGVGGNGYYRAAMFRTDLADDIQFISSGQGAVNAGYFQNIGKTRRQGFELAAGVALAPWRVVASYSMLDATFQSAFEESSPNNVTANANGDIAVVPGNTMPLLPRHTFRVRGDWGEGPFAVGATVLAVSSQYSRGNENNADPGGRVPGFAVVAVDASWRVAPGWLLFARIDNLFNRAYQNFGILGANYFRGPGNTFDAGLAGPEPFRSPAAPIGAWIGIRYSLDGASGSR